MREYIYGQIERIEEYFKKMERRERVPAKVKAIAVGFIF